MTVQISTDNRDLSAGTWEVVLRLVTTVKIGDKTALEVEVQQADTFAIIGCSQQELEHILGSNARRPCFHTPRKR